MNPLIPKQEAEKAANALYPKKFNEHYSQRNQDKRGGYRKATEAANAKYTQVTPVLEKQVNLLGEIGASLYAFNTINLDKSVELMGKIKSALSDLNELLKTEE